jgi:hypothetical protein
MHTGIKNFIFFKALFISIILHALFFFTFKLSLASNSDEIILLPTKVELDINAKNLNASKDDVGVRVSPSGLLSKPLKKLACCKPQKQQLNTLKKKPSNTAFIKPIKQVHQNLNDDAILNIERKTLVIKFISQPNLSLKGDKKELVLKQLPNIKLDSYGIFKVKVEGKSGKVMFIETILEDEVMRSLINDLVFEKDVNQIIDMVIEISCLPSHQPKDTLILQ